jgi:hypothetical protein
MSHLLLHEPLLSPRYTMSAVLEGSLSTSLLTTLPATLPQLLGRADNLKDFVRRGQKEAWVEITLSGGEGKRDYVIRRDMRVAREEGKETCSSTWKINSELRCCCAALL